MTGRGSLQYGGKVKGFWNRLKARWYRKGLEYSNMADVVLGFILPKVQGARTFLDVGCGCGTLALPLARMGRTVTALDPSPAMIEILEEDIKREGLENIKTIAAAWGEVELAPHDVVICANVPELLIEGRGFFKDADRLAEKGVFLVQGADPGADKFYYKELYPLIFKRPYERRSGYIKTLETLKGLGISAGVEEVEYDFDQPFDSMDEAVEFWKEYMGIVTDEHDRKLKDFLQKRLVKEGKVLVARFHKRSAIIWWLK